MEAVEYVIQKGQRPQRTFFMAFGHDEEVRFHFFKYLIIVFFWKRILRILLHKVQDFHSSVAECSDFLRSDNVFLVF